MAATAGADAGAGAADGGAEAQLDALRHALAQVSALEAEQAALAGALSTRAACEAIVAHVEKGPEPLAADLQRSNPWVASATGSGGCCAVQ